MEGAIDIARMTYYPGPGYSSAVARATHTGSETEAMTRGRRFHTPAIWLALIVLAGGVFTLDRTGVFAPESETDEHGHGAETGPRYLVEAPIEHLTAIEIAVDGVTWRFDRDESGTWRHGETVDTAASERIADALAVLGRARVLREVAETEDAEGYGVHEPALSVILHEEDHDDPLRYLFGDLAPDELNRYVLSYDEPAIVTVPDYHAANLVALTESFDSR